MRAKPRYLKPYLLLFATLGIATAFITAVAPERKPLPNVIVILIDTLRGDHIGINGYERNTTPVLDQFAKDNVNFTRAHSAASWTPPSVASIMSGMYASVHGHMPLRSETTYGKRNTKLDESFETIAERLRKAGYDTAALSGNPIISKNFGFAQGFNLFISAGREKADKINRRARKYLGDLRPKNQPFFLYLHYMDPHDPYEPPEAFEKMYSGGLKARNYPDKQRSLMNSYDGEISYVDSRIGELFEYLKSQKLYDDSIIVVLSDHGEQFLERGYQGHADRVYEEEIHVPLMIKAPGWNGTVDKTVSLVDVYPTVLELTGVPFEHRIDGTSLRSNLEKRVKEGVLAEIIRHVNQKAYISGAGSKIVMTYPMERGLVLKDLKVAPEKEEVFDLNDDPFELKASTDPDELKELRASFLDLYSSVISDKGEYSVGEAELDDKTLEQLKSLGYL